MQDTQENGVLIAINKAGGRKKLADMIGVSYEAIRLWSVAGVVPVYRVLEVEKATGVRRELLNPKAYPAENDASVVL
jgi:DNA-binding transcriptional regulator YdaS (Cro superfamily)